MNGKGQQAVQILADIVGQKVIEPAVAGTLIVRKLNELYANQMHLGFVLCGMAFDQGRLLEAVELLHHDGQCVPPPTGARCECGLAELEAILALPLADMREQSAPIPQPGRVITA